MWYKTIYITILCAFCGLNLPAQTLHFILFADTEDESIGKGVMESKDYLCNTLMPTIREKTDLDVIQYIYSGSRFTRSNMNSVISSLSTDEDDAILFYYDGHGYNDKSNDFPSFSLGTGDIREGKTLLSVYKALQAKPHRLLIAISSSCNKLPRNDSEDFDDGRGAAGKPMNIYRKLFQYSSGDYMISSSKKDEYSWVSKKWGDLFSLAFRGVLENWYNDTLPDWPDFLDAVSSRCTQYANMISCSQHPQWISEDYYDGKAERHQNNITTKLPNAEIKKVWVNHNVLKTYGFMTYYYMVIHCHLIIRNQKGKPITCGAYFFHGNGSKLYDSNGMFRALDGQVCAGETVTPSHDNSVWENFDLTIPYSELHLLPGWNTPIKFAIAVSGSDGIPLAQSEFYDFTY
jgi:hypothetical protein